MALTNHKAASMIEDAIFHNKVVTVKCPNGDIVTASKDKIIRWGKSRFALPSGKEIHNGHASPGLIGFLIVKNCGRGNTAKASRC